MNSYVSMLVKPCLATATGWDRVSCSVSETSKFCEFSTHSSVRPAIQTSYVAYASAAAAWYSAKSADIANMKEDCPVTWDNVDEVKQAWFNHTIIQGNCYNQAHNNVTGDGIGSGDGIN